MQEFIAAAMRRAVALELAKARYRAKPVSEGRARLVPIAATVRRLRKAFP